MELITTGIDREGVIRMEKTNLKTNLNLMEAKAQVSADCIHRPSI